MLLWTIQHIADSMSLLKAFMDENGERSDSKMLAIKTVMDERGVELPEAVEIAERLHRHCLI
jgi:hypothetical protein